MSMYEQEPDLGLLYPISVGPEYVDSFKSDAEEAKLRFFIEPQEDGPQAALEWAAIVAFAVFIGKPLIDAYMKKVAEDVADATYPKMKQTVKDFMNKVLVREPIPMIVYATAEEKIKNPKVLRFAIYVSGKGRRGNQKIKFVFDQDLTEEECDVVAEQIFHTLESLHSTQGLDDLISQEIAAVGQIESREAYLLYDKERQKWNAVDPHQEIQQVGNSGEKKS